MTLTTFDFGRFYMGLPVTVTKSLDVVAVLAKRRTAYDTELLVQQVGFSPLRAVWVSHFSLQSNKNYQNFMVRCIENQAKLGKMIQPQTIVGLTDFSGDALVECHLPKQTIKQMVKQHFQASQDSSRFEGEESMFQQQLDVQEPLIKALINDNRELSSVDIRETLAIVSYGSSLFVEKLIFIPNLLDQLKLLLRRLKYNKQSAPTQNFKNISELLETFPQLEKHRLFSLLYKYQFAPPLFSENFEQFYGPQIVQRLINRQDLQLLKLNQRILISKQTVGAEFLSNLLSYFNSEGCGKILIVGRSLAVFAQEIQFSPVNLTPVVELSGGPHDQSLMSQHQNQFVSWQNLSLVSQLLAKERFSLLIIDAEGRKAVNCAEIEQVQQLYGTVKLLLEGQNMTEQVRQQLLFSLLDPKNPRVTDSSVALIRKYCQYEVVYSLLNNRMSPLQKSRSLEETPGVKATFDRELEYFQQSGQKFRVLTFDLSFGDELRQRVFLDHDTAFSRLLGDDKKSILTTARKGKFTGKSTQQQYNCVANYLLANLLKQLWLKPTKADFRADDEAAAEERANQTQIFTDGFVLSEMRNQLLQLFLKSLEQFDIKSVLIVVPDELLRPTEAALNQNPHVLVFPKWHDNVHLDFSITRINVVLLCESQVFAYGFCMGYVNSAFINIDSIPQVVLFPFVNARPIDVIVDSIINQLIGKANVPLIYFCANDSVEEQLLIYRQKMSGYLLQEYENFCERMKKAGSAQRDVNKVYQGSLDAIGQFGFEGPVETIIQEQAGLAHVAKFVYDEFTKKTVYQQIHADFIIQASLGVLFKLQGTFTIQTLLASSLGSVYEQFNKDAEIFSYSNSVKVEVLQNEDNSNCCNLENGDQFCWNALPTSVFPLTKTSKIQQYWSGSQFNNQQALDCVSKLFPKVEAESSVQLLQQFILMAKMKQGISLQQFMADKKSKPQLRAFMPLPPLGIQPSCKRKLLQLFVQDPFIRKVTVCADCGKQKGFGPKCDLCGTTVPESPDFRFSGFGKQANVISENGSIYDISDAIGACPRERQAVVLDFMVNNLLQYVGYVGAARHDQLIVTPIINSFEDEQLQYLYQLLFEGIHDLSQAEQLQLVKVRIAAMASLLNGHRPNTSIIQLSDVQVVSNLQSKGSVWLQIYMNNALVDCFQQPYLQICRVPLKRLLNYAVPYDHFAALKNQVELFNYNTNFAKSLEHLSYMLLQKAYSTIQSSFTPNADLYRYWLCYQTITQDQQIFQRYSVQGQARFVESIVQMCANKPYQSVLQIENFGAISNSQVFNTPYCLQDSYLMLQFSTNVSRNFENLNFSIRLDPLNSQGYSPFIFHRFYRFAIRNMALSTQMFQALDFLEVVQFIEILKSNPEQYRELDRVFKITVDQQFAQCQQQSLDSKFENSCFLVPNTRSIQQYFKEQGITSKKKQEFNAFTKEEEKVASSTVNSSVTLSQSQNVNGRQVPVTPQLQSRIATPAPEPKIVKPGVYFDRIIQELIGKKNGFGPQQVIRRILDHYTSKAYFNRRFLLHVSSTIILDGEDALAHQLGVQIPPNRFLAKRPGSQEQYRALFQCICGDYHTEQPLNSNYKTNKMTQEIVAFLRNMGQKSSIYCSALSDLEKWVIRRVFLHQFIDSSMIVFKEDPVLGMNLFDAQNVFSQSATRFGFADNYLQQINAKDEVGKLYKYVQSLADDATVALMIKLLARFSIQIGSSPCDVFANYLRGGMDNKQLDAMSVFTRCALLSTLIRMINLCAYHDIVCPISVDKYTDCRGSLTSLVHKLENIRLINIKTQSFEYCSFLQRVQQTSKNNQKIQVVDEFVRSMIGSNVLIFNPDYAKNLNQHETEYLSQIIKVAEAVDNENKQIWQIDNNFIEFITRFKQQQTSQSDMRMMYLSSFTINDLDQTDVRQSWVAATALKYMFIQLFSFEQKQKSIQSVFSKLSEEQKSFVNELVSDIQNVWSRTQDYLFMRLIGDYGITDMLMGMASGETKVQEQRYASKVIVLTESRFSDLSSVLESPLYKVFRQMPDTADRTTFNQQQSWLLERLDSRHKSNNSFEQVKENIQKLMQYQIKSLLGPRPKLSKAAVTERSGKLIRALRVERILTVDPLQQNITDVAVAAFSVTREQNLPNPQPNFALIDQKVKMEPITPKKRQVMVAPTTPSVPTKLQPSVMHGSQLRAAPEEGFKREIIDSIQAKPLSFYRSDKQEITQYITSVIRNSAAHESYKQSASMDQFLFHMSSCQRQDSQQWGKLYSFIINDQPVDFDASQKAAQEARDKLKAAGERLYPQCSDESKRMISVQSYIYEQNILNNVVPDEKNALNEIAQKYVESYLNIAYFHAFCIRQDIIENKSEEVIQARCNNIHEALRHMQFMNQIPLNLLIQKQDKPDYKRKMALATYFFLVKQNQGK